MKNSISARSPLSPTLWPKDAFRWWASALLAVAVTIASIVPAVVVLIAIAAAAPGSVRANPAHPTLTWPLLIAQLVSNAGAVAALLLLLPVVANRSLTDLGFRLPRTSDLWWGLGGAALMEILVLAVAAAQQALFHLNTDEVQVQYLRNASGAGVPMIVLVACIAGPFWEELMFRGLVFNAIRRYAPTSIAVILSGLIFGAIHWQPGNAGAIAPLAAGGMALAVVYYRSGSLVASMIAHALFNTITVSAVLVFHAKA